LRIFLLPIGGQFYHLSTWSEFLGAPQMLGIEAKANLSKAEASRLIDEAKMK